MNDFNSCANTLGFSLPGALCIWRKPFYLNTSQKGFGEICNTCWLPSNEWFQLMCKYTRIFCLVLYAFGESHFTSTPVESGSLILWQFSDQKSPHNLTPYPPVFSLKTEEGGRENHPKHWFAAHKNPIITLSRHHHAFAEKNWWVFLCKWNGGVLITSG